MEFFLDPALTFLDLQRETAKDPVLKDLTSSAITIRLAIFLKSALPCLNFILGELNYLLTMALFCGEVDYQFQIKSGTE